VAAPICILPLTKVTELMCPPDGDFSHLLLHYPLGGSSCLVRSPRLFTHYILSFVFELK